MLYFLSLFFVIVVMKSSLNLLSSSYFCNDVYKKNKFFVQEFLFLLRVVLLIRSGVYKFCYEEFFIAYFAQSRIFFINFLVNRFQSYLISQVKLETICELHHRVGFGLMLYVYVCNFDVQVYI